METALDHRTWPKHKLVKRIDELEAKLCELTHVPYESAARKQPRKPKRDFDPSRHSSRFVAFKFAYLGQRYNGLEHHPGNITPLPTIEEELWKALVKTRLLLQPDANVERGMPSWDGCDYSKCGRTDRGVSAFGQVVALRVRSSRPVPGPKRRRAAQPAAEADAVAEADTQVEESEPEAEKSWDPIGDELPYLQKLNRVLPDDIRMLAWLPDPEPDFSARFSCTERRYRYFFSNPAFAPVPGPQGLWRTVSGKQQREGWLDIAAMQDAAKRLEGLHDFRNFCKIDASKQMTNFQRRIFHASIEEVDPRRSPAGYVGGPGFGSGGEAGPAAGSSHAELQTPKLYTFNVNGSAFLWHQVRMMVSVLFLVGQGLEPPSVVSDLLDVEKTPSRPSYEMASDAPLVLWDCVFHREGADGRKVPIKWLYAGDDRPAHHGQGLGSEPIDDRFGRGMIMDSLWGTWRHRKIDEILAGSLLDLAASQGRQTGVKTQAVPDEQRSVRVFEGGNGGRTVGQYVPIMQKKRLEHVEVINAKYRERKGRGEPEGSLDVNEQPTESSP